MADNIPPFSDPLEDGITASGPPPLPGDRRARTESSPLDEDSDGPLRRRRRQDLDDPDIALGDDLGMRMLMPIGRSPWAIASGYLGLFSVLFLPAPLALITGIIAIVHMRRNPKMHGMGRAIFGIIMGTLGTIGLVGFAVAMITHKQ